MLKEILADARNDQEKTLLIWDFVRKNRYHDYPLFVDDELHDPVKYLCIYGAGFCDDSAAVGCSLLYHAGLNISKYAQNPKKRHLHGHVTYEAYLSRGYQFFDIDGHAFYLDRENERIVSGDEIARDHDLAKRDHAFGPDFSNWRVGESTAAFLGSDDGGSLGVVRGHRLDMALRPGEKIVYRWDNVGKVAADAPTKKRRYWGNSLQVYSPRLEVDSYKEGVTSAKDIVVGHRAAEGAKLAGGSRQAYLIYEIKSPYVICGGRVRAEFIGLHGDAGDSAGNPSSNPKPESDRFVISLSVDGVNWKEIWNRAGKGKITCRADLDEQLRVQTRPPKYRYFIRVSLDSAGSRTANLCGLTIETDIMAAPLSLPRLTLGTNNIVYTEETPRGEASKKRHEVTITHRWQESDNIVPPKPPAQPVFPAHNAVVRASTFAFRWPPVNNGDRYHLEVSRYPNMKLSYRPSFDVIISGTSHGSPSTGMFSPDTDYYWRVRTRNREGVWSGFSDVWHFRWDGPRVAVNLKSHIQKNGEIGITWDRNPRGPRPDHYEVYGSDERGFSISREPYNVQGLGKRPANFVCTTTATKLVVVSPKAEIVNMNRGYYRVVAVDKNGTRSGPSDCVELPHPYVFTVPVVTAPVGKPYRYEPKTLRSLGDLQHRYARTTNKFWEREEYQFWLDKGPKWLKLEAATGILTGTPAASDVGSADVEIVVTRRFPHEVKPSASRPKSFQKTAPRYQSQHRHRYRLSVQTKR